MKFTYFLISLLACRCSRQTRHADEGQTDIRRLL
jgi:hypothetical protein